MNNADMIFVMTHTDDSQQATAHTPEPWQITGQSCRDYEGAEIGTGNKTVAVILTADAVEVTEEERANARRIVAAVNACKGISTEALEQGVVAELLQQLMLLADHLETPPHALSEQLRALRLRETRATIAKANGRTA